MRRTPAPLFFSRPWWLIALVACWLGGCSSPDSTGPTAAAIQSADATIAAEGTPPELRDDYFALLTSSERDYVKLAMHLGLAAIRQGRPQFAARVLDQAIKRVEAIQAGSEQAERTRSKFVADEQKWFKGEAYERAALYLYRGLLYLEAGDFGNAAACGKRVQLMDISTHEEAQGDWYSAEWLLAYASLLQGDYTTAQDALARANRFVSKPGVVPPPVAGGSNLLVVVESGNGPIKARRGEYGEELIVIEGENVSRQLQITVDSNPTVTTAAAENLYYQASTRGGRKLDAILRGKAVFKSSTDIAGDVGIVGGAGTLLTSRSETQSLVGAGLLVAGLIGKGISASAHPEADLRSWDNLPHSIYLFSIPAPGPTVHLKIIPLNYQGLSVTEINREVTLDPHRKVNELWLRLP